MGILVFSFGCERPVSSASGEVSGGQAPAEGDGGFYAAPERRGTGDGRSPENAAGYLESAFWEGVREALEDGPRTVRLLPGRYTDDCLYLDRLGHAEHRLTVTGDPEGGTVFAGDDNWQLRLRGSRNIVLRHLHFRGEPANFALHIQSLGDLPARDILIEDCSFVDLLTTRYGALGTSRAVSDVTVRRCTFKRIGDSAHAHMAYNSHGPENLFFYENYFEDTPGDYLRFRNRTGYVEIVGNTFVSTEVTLNRPFIAAPLFNTEAPGTEKFPTRFHIADNVFRYAAWEQRSWDRAYAVTFSVYGHTPEAFDYHLSPDEVAVITGDDLRAARAELLARTGIDASQIHLYGNTFENAAARVVYGAFQRYGAPSRGWEGFIDISGLVSTVPPGTPESGPD